MRATIGGRTCDDTDNASGGSIVVGITNIYSFNDMASVRGELEYNYRGGTDYVTGSFPGPPGPPAFLYSVAVSGQHTGFVNAYIDLKMPNWPVTLYAGGGIGVSGTRVATNDFVVAGTASDTDFAFNLTAGGKYAITDRIDFFGDVRYVDLGTTNVPMFGGGGAPAGNFTVDHESIDIRLGITVKLGEIALPWNN